jgi:hypothetical protein
MRHPSREKQQGVGLRQILRREQLRVVVEKIADVIERHDHHDDAAQDVDGLDAGLKARREHRDAGELYAISLRGPASLPERHLSAPATNKGRCAGAFFRKPVHFDHKRNHLLGTTLAIHRSDYPSKI